MSFLFHPALHTRCLFYHYHPLVLDCRNLIIVLVSQIYEQKGYEIIFQEIVKRLQCKTQALY